MAAPWALEVTGGLALASCRTTGLSRRPPLGARALCAWKVWGTRTVRWCWAVPVTGQLVSPTLARERVIEILFSLNGPAGAPVRFCW